MSSDKLVFGLLIIIYCAIATIAIKKSSDARINKAKQLSHKIDKQTIE